MEVIVCERESSSYDRPDKKVYEGHIDNAGPTLDYRYHRAELWWLSGLHSFQTLWLVE
jgi:hypothetical protein